MLLSEVGFDKYRSSKEVEMAASWTTSLMYSDHQFSGIRLF